MNGTAFDLNPNSGQAMLELPKICEVKYETDNRFFDNYGKYDLAAYLNLAAQNDQRVRYGGQGSKLQIRHHASFQSTRSKNAMPYMDSFNIREELGDDTGDGEPYPYTKAKNNNYSQIYQNTLNYKANSSSSSTNNNRPNDLNWRLNLLRQNRSQLSNYSSHKNVNSDFGYYNDPVHNYQSNRKLEKARQNNYSSMEQYTTNGGKNNLPPVVSSRRSDANSGESVSLTPKRHSNLLDPLTKPPVEATKLFDDKTKLLAEMNNMTQSKQQQYQLPLLNSTRKKSDSVAFRASNAANMEYLNFVTNPNAGNKYLTETVKLNRRFTERLTPRRKLEQSTFGPVAKVNHNNFNMYLGGTPDKTGTINLNSNPTLARFQEYKNQKTLAKNQQWVKAGGSKPALVVPETKTNEKTKKTTSPPVKNNQPVLPPKVNRTNKKQHTPPTTKGQEESIKKRAIINDLYDAIYNEKQNEMDFKNIKELDGSFSSIDSAIHDTNNSNQESQSDNNNTKTEERLNEEEDNYVTDQTDNSMLNYDKSDSKSPVLSQEDVYQVNGMDSGKKVARRRSTIRKTVSINNKSAVVMEQKLASSPIETKKQVQFKVDVSSMKLHHKSNRIKKDVSDDHEDELVENMDDDWLLRWSILKTSQIRACEEAFDDHDTDQKGYLSVEELLRAINSVISLSNVKYNYLISLLSLCNISSHLIDLKLFTLIVSLAHRVKYLDDKWFKNILPQLDLSTVENKLFKVRNLWSYLVDKQTRTINISELMVEFEAGGVTEEHVEYARSKFASRSHFDLLDYLTYIPLFVYIHDRIVQNPFDKSKDI